MFDFKFDWKEELRSGIDEIDEQHKELFRIVRDIEQLLITRCIGVRKEQLYDIIRQLREYVSYHFYEEEIYMRKYNYSKTEEHIKMHQRLYEQVIQIDLPRLGESPYEELKEMKDQIQDWIFEHMFCEDRAMAAEIIERMKQEE